MHDDVHLILKVRNGDAQAYAAIVERYQSSVRACLRMRLQEPAEAEDLTQETFILAFNKLDEFDDSRPVDAWLRGIAINLLRNYIRKHKPISVGSHAELETLINQQLDIDYSQGQEVASVAALKDCMAQLNEKTQKLVNQHYKQGFSIAELTKQHGVRHSAMTMRMFRIREKLRECIEKNLKEYC
ncbi:ECF subfamily RNA polymerase sigma-24 factor [Catenovulum agarivorans DS-2]|uniref:RNA polymerase sigma factor n=1 Tax=Catenovulum agarivorans DS-2 TaxID=1328313 RepID=W7QQR2_9ALTE|nr:sigma-70 family RNA polymerase sigma factor [Catenovulum agarivorans]EWH10218.1 ECF subfamily RNA polymerase sigma-24 factor [Catenovulum agarivorans DS-2]